MDFTYCATTWFSTKAHMMHEYNMHDYFQFYDDINKCTVHKPIEEQLTPASWECAQPV